METFITYSPILIVFFLAALAALFIGLILRQLNKSESKSVDKKRTEEVEDAHKRSTNSDNENKKT
ncbi:hypothetical protein [Planococcus sp. YIM B11945]|uniref:hypothetical protein n=1 Tax=Planococcus sp. YIM B11945 TaxID=3435410 RepID=UPI003D7D00F3